ncbi:9265_t:CDS:2 [Paraglomus brasilianum]|uniref:9265_t:CDS:1 n=1 Tax=Paraglomus brasilianum TaxID=144538 RepID=A0A9N9CD64_9GLOM|nr:9265_t:CDS:2 [Paraglomus brasilianum]
MATQAPTPTPRMDNLVGVYNINHFCQMVREFLTYIPRNNRVAVERALTNLTNAYNQSQNEIVRLSSDLAQSMENERIANEDAMGWQDYNADLLVAWNNSDITRAEIDSMIKSQLALVPTTFLQPTQPASSQRREGQLLRSQMEPGKIYQDPNSRLNDPEWLRMDEATDRLSALAGPSYLQTFMDTISKGVIDRITPLLPKKKETSPITDDVDGITKGMAELSINEAISKGVSKGISQGMKEVYAVSVSSKHRCSKCHRSGHHSNSSRCPKNKKKSRSKKKAMFNDPEVIETIKNNINNTNVSIAKPDFINYREPAPPYGSEIPDSDGEDEMLDDPMEIDFVCRKEPVISIATIPVKIKRLKIPALVLDSGAEPAIVSEDIVKRVGGKIDTSEKYDLSGVATVPTESVGITHNLPITFSPGFTIREDFVVVRVPKPTLIFPNPLLKKYKCAVDWGNDKMKIHYNGEDFIIPVTMHKVKNKLEVNCATASQNDKPLISNQIPQNIDGSEDDNIPFEKWCTPAGFSLNSENLTLKKNA